MFSFSNFWEFDAPPMNQKPGKANFRELVSKKIPGGACPRAPLEACSLGPSFRKSVSIYPRSAPGFSMIVPVMAISNLVLTRQIYSEEINGAHAHYREPVL